MKKHVSTLAAVLVLAGAAATGSAQAAPLTGAIPVPSVGEMLVQKTQFYYQDREYCWYPNGWRGPGCTGAATPGAGATAGVASMAGTAGRGRATAIAATAAPASIAATAVPATAALAVTAVQGVQGVQAVTAADPINTFENAEARQ